MSKLNTTFMVVILWTWVAYGAILLVPSQYPTIQAGINAALDGDTVLVADGTYTGTGNKNIDFLGKAIVVISENGPEACAIDCQNDGRGFYLHSEEDSNSVLCGFKVTNGRAEEGGAISLSDCSPTISNCVLQGNVASYEDGGGIFCWASSPRIENCAIIENTVLGWLRGYGHGGGISCTWGSHPKINNTVIAENSVYSSWITNGGGIYCIYGSSVDISHSTISGNSSINGSGGGLWSFDGCTFRISNCTIFGNSASEGGGILVGWSCNLNLVNSIVSGNENNGVEFAISYSAATLTHCDFHENEGGNFTGWNVPAQLGHLSTINANGDSCDIFYNIFEDPLFADPASGNFQITWANYPIPDSTRSPCIDAGDPDSPLDPDSTIADMGAFYFDQNVSLQICLSPIHPPIIIPQSGGSFSFHVTLSNASNITQNFDAWCNVEVPGGSQFTVLGPVNLTLNAGASLTRLRTQAVPASAPGGEYGYWGFVGDYPWTVTDSDHFAFVKQGSEAGSISEDGWICGGELFPGEIGGSPSVVSEFALHKAFPNPFNPTTAIRFQLPEGSQVELKVFDVSGRLVATLVDGWREAGVHEVTFDGTDLPSGIYLVRLEAGGFTAVQKMALLK